MGENDIENSHISQRNHSHSEKSSEISDEDLIDYGLNETSGVSESELIQENFIVFSKLMILDDKETQTETNEKPQIIEIQDENYMGNSFEPEEIPNNLDVSGLEEYSKIYPSIDLQTNAENSSENTLFKQETDRQALTPILERPLTSPNKINKRKLKIKTTAKTPRYLKTKFKASFQMPVPSPFSDTKSHNASFTDEEISGILVNKRFELEDIDKEISEKLKFLEKINRKINAVTTPENEEFRPDTAGSNDQSMSYHFQDNPSISVNLIPENSDVKS